MIIELRGKKISTKGLDITSSKSFIETFEKLKPWRVMPDDLRLKALKEDWKVYSKALGKDKKEGAI